MVTKAKLGHTGSHADDKAAAEKQKTSTIIAASFDRLVADKMGPSFKRSFLPKIRELVEAGLSYDEVKRLVKIPGMWGDTISGERFTGRAVPPKVAGR